MYPYWNKWECQLKYAVESKMNKMRHGNSTATGEEGKDVQGTLISFSVHFPPTSFVLSVWRLRRPKNRGTTLPLCRKLETERKDRNTGLTRHSALEAFKHFHDKRFRVLHFNLARLSHRKGEDWNENCTNSHFYCDVRVFRASGIQTGPFAPIWADFVLTISHLPEIYAGRPILITPEG